MLQSAQADGASRNGNVVLRIQGAAKTYASQSGSCTALLPVTSEVRAGEFISLVGPSGCGKTTLLKMCAGLITPSAGTITFGETGKSIAPGEFGFVFQAPALLPWRTVLSNVALPADILGLDKAAATERARALLATVRLAGAEEKYPRELSGGMQQRAALVRALSFKPSVLLMDEPFGALDAFTREEMNRLVEKIWLDAPTTIVLITHSIDEAIFLSDRIIVMSQRPGRVASIHNVDFPRPRSLEIMATREVFELTNTIKMEIVGGQQSRYAAQDTPVPAPAA